MNTITHEQAREAIETLKAYSMKNNNEQEGLRYLITFKEKEKGSYLTISHSDISVELAMFKVLARRLFLT